MEKIKAALAKVKSRGEVLTKSKKISKRVDSNQVSDDISKINYTTTKVIELDAKHLETHRVVSHESNNLNTSIFDSLRTQIIQKMEENSWQSIAIVSPTPDSGKTLVSINLAMSISRQPKKTTILVDFDLRKPKVASYLGIETDSSMNEFFHGKANIEDVLINPSIQRLVIMPTMRPVADSSEELASSKVESMIEEFKERYASRIIIYDLPPLLSTDDALVVLPQIDCVLLVVASGVSTPSEIEDALHLIPKDKLVGVVYNKAEDEPKAYYY